MKLRLFNLLRACIIIAVLASAAPFTAGNEALHLNVVTAEESTHLRISLDTDESGQGKTAMVKILDSAGNRALQSNIELVPSPFYATVDIKSLAKGSYSVILITDKRVYDSKLDLN